MVYQLADELNKLNGNDPEHKVDFIKWINSDPNSLMYYNEFKLPSGLPPTVGQIRLNSTLGPPASVLPESAQALRAEYRKYLPQAGEEIFDLVAKNIFDAHEEWLKNGMKGMGGDVWSEFAFMVNHLGGALNDTDALGAAVDHGYWSSLYNTVFFAFGDWRTIDGGLSRLPNAFGPLLGDDISFKRRIERVKHHSCSKKIELFWRDDSAAGKDLQSAIYDYAVISAPFSVVRDWRMPALDGPIANAIRGVRYTPACKVALEYSERFWEKYDNPIFGGCSTSTDIPNIGSVCYPSYNINSTGPASILASYVSGYGSLGWLARSEEEHVQYALDAMAEIHGEDTRALYTGNYNRQCWSADPTAVGGWADPTVGQHQLYIPEYHKTHKNVSKRATRPGVARQEYADV